MASAEWLIVVDMQRAFLEPGVWQVPGFRAAAAHITRLFPRYAGRVIMTRHVPPDPIAGAWQEYFAKFPTMRLPADDSAWDIGMPFPPVARVETRTTFGKWDAAIARTVGRGAPIAVCGVVTECCVLATVLAAVDMGHQVRVIEDACAGATAELHAQAMQIMATFAPMVRIERRQQGLAI